MTNLSPTYYSLIKNPNITMWQTSHQHIILWLKMLTLRCVVKTHKPSWTLHPNIIRTIVVSNVTNDVIYPNPLWTSYIVFECLRSPMYLSRSEIKQRLCHIVTVCEGFMSHLCMFCDTIHTIEKNVGYVTLRRWSSSF